MSNKETRQTMLETAQHEWYRICDMFGLPRAVTDDEIVLRKDISARYRTLVFEAYQAQRAARAHYTLYYDWLVEPDGPPRNGASISKFNEACVGVRDILRCFVKEMVDVVGG